MIALAQIEFEMALRHKVDAEDVVQSVFRSFFTRQREGQFVVTDWDNLWALLATITVRKCTNVRVAFGHQGRNVQREIQVDWNAEDRAASWEVLAHEPTPVQAAVLSELVENLLLALPERERRIVALSLEGNDCQQISAAINRAERTVRRTSEHFRQRLEEAVLEPASWS